MKSIKQISVRMAEPLLTDIQKLADEASLPLALYIRLVLQRHVAAEQSGKQRPLVDAGQTK